MPVYVPAIGLEIHAELKTKTKMFCGCRNDSDENRPNVNVCPICLGHPGTLPVINKEAVKAILKLGLALKAKIPEQSKFDRKNYFYPDLPKGYQISQYDEPLVSGGELKGVRIRRVHLEEDTGKLVHSPDGESSLVDFNRAGVPLMELVTEPNIKSGKEAVDFAKELQLILRYLGVSDADMEKGQMRVEANVSISDKTEPAYGGESLGTKVEIKNLNSFRAVEEAVNYELKRQAEILEKGEKVRHETRGWDEFERKTIHQRAKEEAHDYRYFPEPDLPPLDLSVFNFEEIRNFLPELPDDKRKRFEREFSLSPEQAGVLIQEIASAGYFEKAASDLKAFMPAAGFRLLYHYFTSDLWGLMKKAGTGWNELKVAPERFAHLISFLEKNELTSRTAKDVLAEMFETGADPETIIKDRGLVQISDSALIEETVERIIAANPGAAADYRKGKENAVQFLIGRAMTELKGRADAEVLKNLFKLKL